jgi:hypothetical protein
MQSEALRLYQRVRRASVFQLLCVSFRIYLPQNGSAPNPSPRPHHLVARCLTPIQLMSHSMVMESVQRREPAAPPPPAVRSSSAVSREYSSTAVSLDHTHFRSPNLTHPHLQIRSSVFETTHGSFETTTTAVINFLATVSKTAPPPNNRGHGP